jgi:hypothetical protein
MEKQVFKGFKTYEDFIYHQEQKAFTSFINYLIERNKKIEDKEKFEEAIEEAKKF